MTGGGLGFGRLRGGPITGKFLIVLETNTGPGVVSYRIVSYRIVSYRIVSYRIVSCRVVSYRIVSYRIVVSRIVKHCDPETREFNK
jgi:hypothetical protein